MSSFLAMLAAQAAAPEKDLKLLIVVLVLYVMVIGYIGFRGFRSTKTATDYLLAGRNVPPYVMALSYGSAFISTAAIVGFGGVAALMGMGLLWLTFLNIFVGIFIAFVFFGKRTRRMGKALDAHTFPEFLGRRYQSRFIQMFSAGVIFLLMPLYAAAVLRGGAEFLSVAFEIGLPVAICMFALIIAVYVVAGGLKGVMMIDALQGSIMFAGMLFLLGFTYYKCGGFVGAHEALTALGNQVPESLVDGGHRGWTSMPAFGSPIWLTLVTTIIMGVGIGVLAQPQLAVRFMTVKSGRELNRAVLAGGAFIMVLVGSAFIVGALSNVYFFQTEGKIAVAAAGGNVDAIIPLYINSAMPQWFVGLFLLVLLSAAMSTLSSQFHAMGTAISRDLYEQGLCKGDARGRSIVMLARGGIIIAFFVTVWLSLIMPVSIIASATAIFFGTCAVAFLPMYIGGIYSKKITRAGAMAGLVSGFALALFWLLFIHEKNAGRLGLCEFLLGQPNLGKFPWTYIDPLIVALPVSTAVTVIVSMLTKKLPEAHLNFCFGAVKQVPSPDGVLDAAGQPVPAPILETDEAVAVMEEASAGKDEAKT